MAMLRSVMYHYVRNPEETPYKGIKAVLEQDFIRQVDHLRANYEMATASSIREFLSGNYSPEKDLCVLTFDDGLKEHGQFVTEVLQSRGIEGQFFIPTACITEGYVLPVHKNHFLLASLDFEYYEQCIHRKLDEFYPEVDRSINNELVKKTYRWDTLEVSRFKYLINYKLSTTQRNKLLKLVFEEEIGSEADFARELYLDWAELKQMQEAGMVIGGHSHTHPVLAHLTDEEQENEVLGAMEILRKNLIPQSIWPFSYPFGKPNTYNAQTLGLLGEAEVPFAYCTLVGDSTAGEDPYQIKRIDPKDIKI